jgi:membrane protein DedA with SNARE-associated domain
MCLTPNPRRSAFAQALVIPSDVAPLGKTRRHPCTLSSFASARSEASTFMDPAALIAAYGSWVLALGCLAEGETMLLLAGFAASRGHLDPAAVVVVAATAGFIGDQIFFWLGRRHGTAVLARFPSVAHQAGRVFHLIQRYQAWVIVGVRFAYGLRIAGPIIIGTSQISPLRFLVFNAIGAVIWAVLVAGIGYLFGEAAEALLGELHDIEIWLLLGLFGAAMLVLLVQYLRARTRTEPTREE